MELIKWEPFGEINRLFDGDVSPFLPKLGWDLSVDVYEENKKIVAKISLPAIKPEEIDVAIEDDVLTISGRRDEEKETKEKDYYCKEIRRGSFSRSIRLPKAVEVGKADAQYENGVLMVTVPVAAGAKEKIVKVKVHT